MNFCYIGHYGASTGDDFDVKNNLFKTYQMVIQRIPLYTDH